MKKLFLYAQLLFILLIAGCATAPRTASLSGNAPTHVALLVPLSGPLAPYGNAIRNGFFTAYYSQSNASGQTIDVIDTNGQPVTSAYQRAVQQGATLVVGPLDKNDVTQLAQQHLSVPVLALNRTSGLSSNGALIQYALSPTDEAEAAANKATQDGHHSVIILAPQNSLGTRMVSAFTTQWQKNGGKIVAVKYYNDISTLSQSISDVLQINEGRDEAKSLERMLHRDVRYIPQRRHDFDSIFMVATPTMAKQILLLLRFYFVENTPIYATSQVYNGIPDNDLNGVMFCDMPWILAPNQMSSSLQTMQQQIQNTWPNNYTSLAKFYAMGVDAYDLMPVLHTMQSSSSATLSGATGLLSLSPDHQIQRQLLWAKINNGVPVVQ